MTLKEKDCYYTLKNLSRNKSLSSMQIAVSMIDCAVELFSYSGLENLIVKIVNGQPSMAAVINIGLDVIESVKKSDKNSLSKIKNKILNSSAAASDEAAEFLNGVKNIATISYSQSVLDAVLKIRPDKVYLSVSHPAGEGEILAAALAENGIEAVLFEDSAYSLIIEDVDAVLTGADAVFDNSFINKTGTFSLALLAKEFSVPFYVVSCLCKYLDKAGQEFFKVMPMPEVEVSKVNCKRLNAYFEEIPMKFVNKMFVR